LTAKEAALKTPYASADGGTDGHRGRSSRAERDVPAPIRRCTEMTQHTTFEVHLTPHPRDAAVITGLSAADARALAEAEQGVVVERLMSLDALDALAE
jgi:hypothetical protein